MKKELLTNGNAFKRTDGRWGGVVWYKNEKGERTRKSFSGTTKLEVKKKMKNYIKSLRMNWLNPLNVIKLLPKE